MDLSKSEHKTVLNVDMGGGTTKFSLIEDGVKTAAISIGARLIAFDENNDDAHRRCGPDNDEGAGL